MNLTDIISSIEQEIARLTQVLEFLQAPEAGSPAGRGRRRGRPKGSTLKFIPSNPAGSAAPKQRVMSPEGRERIAAAQRKRRALRNRAAAKATGLPAAKTVATKRSPARSVPAAKKVSASSPKKDTVRPAARKGIAAKKIVVPAKAAAKPTNKPSAKTSPGKKAVSAKQGSMPARSGTKQMAAKTPQRTSHKAQTPKPKLVPAIEQATPESTEASATA